MAIGKNDVAVIGGVRITSDMLESLQIPLHADEIGMTPGEKFNMVDCTAAVYIAAAVKEVRERGLSPAPDYRVHWWRAMQDFVDSEQGQKLNQQAHGSTKEDLERQTSKLGIEGEAIARMGPELVNLLTDKAHALAPLIRDNFLSRLYFSDCFLRANHYVAEYARLLSSQKKNIRILEIGAGTCGTTMKLLEWCSPYGQSFCAQYMFTDISSAFFNDAETRLEQWEHLLTFKVLNIENDPASQGFQEHAYDLIVAANVIHATPCLVNTLRNVHKLLKPGGVFGLVELTPRFTPYLNLVFGPISGWWAGVDEGRTESPLQSAEQWNELLKTAGFSGVDLVANDFPAPERQSCLMLATALD